MPVWLLFLNKVPSRVWVGGAFLAATVSLGGWLYHSGRVAEREQVRREALQVAQVTAKTAREKAGAAVVGAEVHEDSVREESKRADVAQVKAKAKVHIVSDTSLVVTTETGTTTVAVPKEVTELLRADSTALAQKDSLLVAKDSTKSTLVQLVKADTVVVAVQDSILTAPETHHLRTAGKVAVVAGAVVAVVKYGPELLKSIFRH